MATVDTSEERFDLTPAGAGELVGLHPDTISDYARSGRLPSRRTPGGHRRFRRSDVLALLTADAPTEAAS